MSKNKTDTPDFLIVGAAKSGTSSLHSYLKKHPDIYMPERKELYFWHIASNINRSFIKHYGEDLIPTQLDEYLEYFKASGKDQIRGEACPSYLYFHDDVLQNLKKHHDTWQDVKIIIILRDPVSRIISEYRYVCKRKLDPDFLSFSESLKAEPDRVKENTLLPDLFYTELSKYAKQVDFYLKNFNKVHVCLYDDLKQNPRALMDDLCTFLEVNPEKLPHFEFEVLNASSDAKMLKYPLLSLKVIDIGRSILGWLPSTLKNALRLRFEEIFSEPIVIPDQEIMYLRQIFEPEIKSLEGVLNRDLSAWMLSEN